MPPTKLAALCSHTAMRELPEEVRNHIVQSAVTQALPKDRGVHEGLAFSFDLQGKTWMVVVDLQERWVKILSKEEMDSAISEATARN